MGAGQSRAQKPRPVSRAYRDARNSQRVERASKAFTHGGSTTWAEAPTEQERRRSVAPQAKHRSISEAHAEEQERLIAERTRDLLQETTRDFIE